MPNTYTQSAVHAVFAVKRREALILPSIREEVQKFMAGNLKHQDQKPLSLYAMPDHVHVLFAHSMTTAPCDIMRVLKSETSEWINRVGLLGTHFEWQRGYGWFHVSRSHIPRVAAYIEGQAEHHRRVRFSDEYPKLLRQEGVDYDPRFLFREPL